MNALHPIAEHAVQNQHGKNSNGHVMAQKQAQSRLIAEQIAEWVAGGGCITVAGNAGPFERFNKDHWSREQIQARREKLAEALRKVQKAAKNRTETPIARALQESGEAMTIPALMQKTGFSETAVGDSLRKMVALKKVRVVGTHKRRWLFELNKGHQA